MMVELKEFETALMRHLGDGQLDKSLLKNVSSKIVELKRSGLGVDQVFVKGKVRLDRVLINGIIDPEFWAKFPVLGKGFKQFEVFPYGIINPEGFKFKATMNL